MNEQVDYEMDEDILIIKLNRWIFSMAVRYVFILNRIYGCIPARAPVAQFLRLDVLHVGFKINWTMKPRACDDWSKWLGSVLYLCTSGTLSSVTNLQIEDVSSVVRPNCRASTPCEPCMCFHASSHKCMLYSKSLKLSFHVVHLQVEPKFVLRLQTSKVQAR